MKKLSMRKWSGAAVVLVTVFGVATVDADSITIEAPFPGTAEVIAATPDEGTFGDDANISLAQTFSVVSAFSAQSIFLEYENDPTADVDWNMTVRIFEVADVQATNLVAAGSDLYTGTFTFPAVGGADTIASLSLTTPLLLNASVGTAGYAIQITEATGGDFNPGWEWLRTVASAGDVYGGGQAYEDGDYQVDRDFVLAISSTPVPEPTSMALVLLGGLVLTFRRKR